MVTSDLYRMGFAGLESEQLRGFALEVEDEISKIEAADLMIWQFPLWCFDLPAVLKGWVDCVFAMRRTYGHGHIYETGKLKQ